MASAHLIDLEFAKVALVTHILIVNFRAHALPATPPHRGAHAR